MDQQKPDRRIKLQQMNCCQMYLGIPEYQSALTPKRYVRFHMPWKAIMWIIKNPRRASSRWSRVFVFTSLSAPYSRQVSNVTMVMMLISMDRELMEQDRPKSPRISSVKPGTAEPMGLTARITSARRTPRSKGSRNQ